MTNLIVNGGLEAWTGAAPDSWTKTVAGASTVTQDASDPRAGASCALVSIDSGSNGQIVQAITPVVGAIYTFSVWYKCAGAGGLSARVIILNGADSGKWLRLDGSWGAAQNLPLTVNAAWTQYSVVAAGFPSAGDVSITLRDLDGGTYAVRVDDVSFTTPDVAGDYSSPHSSKAVKFA